MSNKRSKPFGLAGEFKPPGQGGPNPDSPGNARKKQRKGAANSTGGPQTSPSMSDLGPPPLSGYGDTIVASNPFDDTPSHPQMGHMGGPGHGMGMGPMGMNGMGPGGMSMGPMGGMGMGMNPMGPGMNSMNPMGGNMQMGCGIPSPSFSQNMGSKPMPVSAGKVYPVDQPMVFNPQNPNAPPIYPCGICHKEVHDNDQAILCESGCNFWFHRMCTGLTEAAFHLLTAEVYAEWVCDKCLHSKSIPQVKFKP